MIQLVWMFTTILIFGFCAPIMGAVFSDVSGLYSQDIIRYFLLFMIPVLGVAIVYGLFRSD
ncbi:hypothetical protein GQ473_02485 [archaeon]|nr:hypothetical protein [archaeon]